MKKFILYMIIGLCAVALSAVSAFAEDNTVKIASTSGKVLVKIGDSAEWADAKIGQLLRVKDSINTAEDGKAVLEFPDKSSVALKSNTKIAIEELVWNDAARKVGINMSAGELRTMLKKFDKPSEFKVKTPTAVCGARGTVFYVIVFADGTGLYVEEGLADILNSISGESYTVYRGMRSDAFQNGATSTPRELSKTEVDQILAGWNTVIVPEPYAEPPTTKDPNDTQAPDITQEGTASQT